MSGYAETCPKCNGSGRYAFVSTYGSKCLRCGGTGKLVFNTSPEARAKVRERAANKKERDAHARFEKWCLENPAEGDWLQAKLEATDGGSNGFVTACRDGIWRFGSPTPNMVAAIQRAIVRDAEQAEQRAADAFRAQEESRPVHTVNLEAVEEAFARARGQGIKSPKLQLDGFKLKPAKEGSRNPGAIYVTDGAGDGLYLGKVLKGVFEPARACTPETRDKVLAAMADPLASAVAYGKKYGRCAVCARELTDEESIARGIGPVCAERMGW